eukprot:15432990-Alexandrium_andersonii.AAC.1
MPTTTTFKLTCMQHVSNLRSFAALAHMLCARNEFEHRDCARVSMRMTVWCLPHAANMHVHSCWGCKCMRSHLRGMTC